MNLNYTHGFIDTISVAPSSSVLQLYTSTEQCQDNILTEIISTSVKCIYHQ